MITAADVRQARFNRLRDLKREAEVQRGSEGRRSIELAQELASGYVWGWQDALAEGKPFEERMEIIDTDVATQFGREYGIHAARFALGERSSRTNPGAAWKRWRDGSTDEREW